MSKSFFKYAALFVVVCTYTITNIIWGNVWSYQYIQPKSPKVNVEKIQKLFSKLNIYNWEITGNYNDIKDEIISFWTKIEIEWLWVWTVEDRGWAIVRAGVRWYEYDRLDIWMWYGDEWLTKALNWWKRTVKWKIVENTVTNTIEYSWSTKQKSSDSIAINITPQSSSKDIKSMQTLFSEAELYSWNINWKYSSFKNSIIDFQIETKVIPTRKSLWHWYIWKKTIAKLEAVYPEIFLKSKRKNQPEIKENSKVENQSKKDEYISYL